jgi:hypothetical protein
MSSYKSINNITSSSIISTTSSTSSTVDLSSYAKISALASYTTTTALTTLLESYATVSSLTSYTTTSALTTLLSSYATVSSLSSYTTTSALTTLLSSYATVSSLSSYTTTSALTTLLASYATVSSLTSYTTTTALTTLLASYATITSLSSYASLSALATFTAGVSVSGGVLTTRGLLYETGIAASGTASPFTLDYSLGGIFYIPTSSVPTSNFSVIITNIPTDQTKIYTITLIYYQASTTIYGSTVRISDTVSSYISGTSSTYVAPLFNGGTPSLSTSPCIIMQQFTVSSISSVRYTTSIVGAYY